MISFRIDRFDLLAVQRTLKNLLQHHNSKASVLLHSVFRVQLTSVHDYWKCHSFDLRTFVGKVMFLLLYLVWVCHSFLPRSKHLLISWLQSPSTVILEPKKSEFLSGE